MPTDGQEVEMRGILETISNRFYTGGWGFGTLSTDQGPVKITGSLEGHVAGTSLVVRGCYKDTSYGLQLDCSTIVVDSVSGDMNVIRSWARKTCKEHESAIHQICRFMDASERWPVLTNKDRLMTEGLEEEDAVTISTRAKAYLVLIETKKGLMEQGFTDAEAEKMFAMHGENVIQVLKDDPYGFVIDRILPFNRVDAVVAGRIPRNETRRLHAALVQALVGALRNGHTAVSPKGAMQEAAEVASVYIDAVQKVGLPKREIIEYQGKLQLRSTAYAEQDIATWIVEAIKREEPC